MKLITLLHCDMFRDGGSLEGVWETDEQTTWAVTLQIQPGWQLGPEHSRYKLYNCEEEHTKSHNPVAKNSEQHKQILAAIENWMKGDRKLGELEEQLGKGKRVTDLWRLLQEGKY